tara:strand:- start:60 stop:707 length:648 start_codon:yes stop_codon:yes gene_type:complete
MSAKNDQQLLAEAYQQIEEGLWDRVKARTGQAVGWGKGVGGRVKGKAKDLAGGVAGAAGEQIAKGVEAVGGTIDPEKNKLAKWGKDVQKSGAADTSAGKAAGQDAKYASYIKNSANTIVNDLNKLGMEVADPDALNNELQKLVSKHLTQVGDRGRYKRGGGDNRGKGVGPAQKAPKARGTKKSGNLDEIETGLDDFKANIDAYEKKQKERSRSAA